MDIRKFFTAPRKRAKTAKSEESNESDAKNMRALTHPITASLNVQPASSSAAPTSPRELEKIQDSTHPTTASLDVQPSTSAASTSSSLDTLRSEEYHSQDLGSWIGRSSCMSTAVKMEALKRCWTPPSNYDFRNDVEDSSRKFKFEWLTTYSPWLQYSKKLKGALCLYCVLFPPKNAQGVLGSFIQKPFKNYKKMHEYCKNHSINQWHLGAAKEAKSFMEGTPVSLSLQTGHNKTVEKNRKIISSIISTIIFCGTHDMPLRGKDQNEGVFQDLLKLQVKAGDQSLKQHFDEGRKNAFYTSPQIQNGIIDLCAQVIKDEIINDAKHAAAYSVLGDESRDISGKEQLSIGIRFYDQKKQVVREEFAGFVELHAMDAKTIAVEIEKFIFEAGLDPHKFYGQGYDGCSTMSGKDNGVQAILRTKFPNALYFHCASHKLNLVVNDLNDVPEIRNTTATIKDVINFYRDSTTRRKYVPNIPAFCETRWSEKYKSIAIFKENFVHIVNGLEQLSIEGNSSTRKSAFQLHAAVTRTTFIVCLSLISKYSAYLQPVVNILQSKKLDLLACKEQIHRITFLAKDHRTNADSGIEELLSDSKAIAGELGLTLQKPRTINRQQNRSNHPSSNDVQFWKISLLIPYLDSLINALVRRFPEENLPAYSLFHLHPANMLEMNIQEFKSKTKDFTKFYNLQGFDGEAELWYDFWEKQKLSSHDLQKIELCDLVKEAEMFYPTTMQALHIALALPCTTSSIERTFSTLRRVKTWLRSTMRENRLNGLCMLSVHRKMVQGNEKNYVEKVLERFAEDPRRLALA